MFFKKIYSKAFSLIEVIVVAGITILVMTSLANNFLKARVTLSETARTLVSDIRMAQANALSSKQYINPVSGVVSYRCGYGVHLLTNGEANAANISHNLAYYLFTGRTPSGLGDCDNQDFENVTNTPPIGRPVTLDSNFEFYDQGGSADGDFYDIYFESPGARLFIGNANLEDNNLNPADDLYKSTIKVRKNGANCPSVSCIYICVYATGKIETRTDMCPTS